MSQGESGRPLPPGDLPPVQAPNAGFILQLFVIPGVIVVAIFVIVGLLRMMAQTPSDPWTYVTDLGKGGEARWRAAMNLANMLRDSSQEQIKRDPRLAGELARILDNEMQDSSAAQMQPTPISLRVYLSRALGEFYADRGLDVLIKAASTQRDEAEIEVQQAALSALAVLIDNLRHATGQEPSDPKLLETLLALSHDKSELIRSSAAYALGVLGTQPALARLEQMTEDEVYPDALYNAATGLARHGNLKAVDTLVEMLDPTQNRAVDLEKEKDAQQYKRALIIINALRATDQLAAAQPEADLSRLTKAIEELQQANVDPRVKTDAAPVLAKLRRRRAPAAP